MNDVQFLFKRIEIDCDSYIVNIYPIGKNSFFSLILMLAYCFKKKVLLLSGECLFIFRYFIVYFIARCKTEGLCFTMLSKSHSFNESDNGLASFSNSKKGLFIYILDCCPRSMLRPNVTSEITITTPLLFGTCGRLDKYVG